MPGPLTGVRIVDLTWGIAGPLATMTLSDQGAEVILVEPPGGHPFRSYGGYVVWDRGKKSIVLDLKEPGDKAEFRKLLATADVLVESHAPGSMARLGLDHASLKDDFPRLVYCSLTGYVRGTRDEGRPGIDALVQARTGQQFEQAGWRDGPIFLHMPMPSMAASYLVASGIAAALYVREITGRGQWVETSLHQGVLAFTTQLWQWAEHMESWFGIAKQAQPSIYECADGLWVHSMHMAGGRGKDRSATWRILGIPPADNPMRGNYEEADRALRAAFKRHPRKYILEQFWANDLPIQAIQPVWEAYDDPQTIANEAVTTVTYPTIGLTKQLGLTFRLHACKGQVQGPAPRSGQHTNAVLASVGAVGAQGPAPSDERGPEGGDAPGGGRMSRPVVDDRRKGDSVPLRVLRHALEGIKVLDFGNFLAGPFGPMILGDLGATVYKLESTEGDQMRHATMPFNGCQRGKIDLAVDLKKPAGLEIARRLMAKVDIIHHNFRPGVAERLGIGYEDARKLNPRVIYCHTPAYGITGPKSAWPGFDQLYQAMCGLEYEAGGEGNPPVWLRFGMCDTGNAFQSVIGVLLALYWREKTGQGQFVDTSLLNCGLYYNSEVWIGPNGPFRRPRLDKDQTGLGPLYRLYNTSDGWIAVACLNEEQVQSLFRTIGLVPGMRFLDRVLRRQHAKELAKALEAKFATRPAKEWFDALDRASVPCEIADPEAGRRWLHDPELLAKGLVVEREHLQHGRMRQFGHLINFSETPGRIGGAPPVLGQHTRQVLAELGYTADEIARLKIAGVVTWPEQHVASQPAATRHT